MKPSSVRLGRPTPEEAAQRRAVRELIWGKANGRYKNLTREEVKLCQEEFQRSWRRYVARCHILGLVVWHKSAYHLKWRKLMKAHYVRDDVPRKLREYFKESADGTAAVSQL